MRFNLLRDIMERRAATKRQGPSVANRVDGLTAGSVKEQLQSLSGSTLRADLTVIAMSAALASQGLTDVNELELMAGPDEYLQQCFSQIGRSGEVARTAEKPLRKVPRSHM